MTILNDFAKAADSIAEHLGRYFGTRDPREIAYAVEKLQEQVAAFQTEIVEPRLQETAVSLTGMSGEELFERIGKTNALVLQNRDYLATGVIEEGKLIRVKPWGYDDERVFLMCVTLSGDDRLILAPVVAA